MKKILITVFAFCSLFAEAQQKYTLTYSPICYSRDSLTPVERDLGEFEIIGTNEKFDVIVKSNNKSYSIPCYDCDYDLRKFLGYRLTRVYGKKTANYVIKGDVYIGMQDKALLLSWGKPLSIKKKNINGTEIDKYVYLSCDVYVKNGKIVHFKNRL